MHIARLCGFQLAVGNMQMCSPNLTAPMNANRTPFHYAVLCEHSVHHFFRSNTGALFIMVDRSKLTLLLHDCRINGMSTSRRHPHDHPVAAQQETTKSAPRGRHGHAVCVKRLVESAGI